MRPADRAHTSETSSEQQQRTPNSCLCVPFQNRSDGGLCKYIAVCCVKRNGWGQGAMYGPRFCEAADARRAAVLLMRRAAPRALRSQNGNGAKFTKRKSRTTMRATLPCSCWCNHGYKASARRCRALTKGGNALKIAGRAGGGGSTRQTALKTNAGRTNSCVCVRVWHATMLDRGRENGGAIGIKSGMNKMFSRTGGWIDSRRAAAKNCQHPPGLPASRP